MGDLQRNVCVDNVWYGPDYPDAGDPPRGSVGDHVFVEEGDEPDPVGSELVTTREQAAQFGDPAGEGDEKPPAPASKPAAEEPRVKRQPRGVRAD